MEIKEKYYQYADKGEQLTYGELDAQAAKESALLQAEALQSRACS